MPDAITPPLGYKCIDVDSHFCDAAPGLLADLDPREFAQRVHDAGADSIMLYGKDHWGNAYHETYIGHKHPAVSGDLLAQQLQVADELGLKTTVFFSVCWDEHAAADNPDWIARDPDGAPKRWYGDWTFCCINSPYRDYIFAHLAELVGNYDFASIFIDPFNYRLGVNAPCYCRYCQALWAERYGGRIPADLRGHAKARYMDFRDDYFGSFLRRLRQIVKAPNKGIAMTHIFGTVMDYDDYLNVEGDPFGQDYFTNSIKTKIFRDYAQGRQLQVLTERFSRYWDFTMKSPEQLRWELSTILAHNATFMLVDHADFKGALHPEAYEVIGQVFEDLRPLQEAVEGSTPYAEVALLYHERDEELVLEPLEDELANRHLRTVYRGHVPDFVGAFKLLTEAHVPFDVVTAPNLTAERLARYRAVVVPSVAHMSPEQIEIVRDYVRGGGSLLFAEGTAVRDEQARILPPELQRLGLVRLDHESPYTTNFVQLSEPIAGSRYLRVNNGAVAIEVDDTMEPLGHHAPAAVQRTERKWVTHNDIPGETTGDPAIVVGRYGEGTYGFCAFRFFREALEQDLQVYGRLFAELLERCGEAPSVTVDAPRSVEANFLERDGKLVVVLTNCTVSRPAGRYDVIMTTPEPLTYPVNIQEVVPVAGISVTAGDSSVSVSRLDTFDVVTIDLPDRAPVAAAGRS